MTIAEHRIYSPGRAVRALLTDRPLDGLEREIHDELGLHASRSRPDLPDVYTAARGVWIPWRLEARALDTAAGAGSIQATVSPDLIDVLRAKSVILKLGTEVVEDMSGSGTFAIPRKTATATAGWTTEGNPVGGPQSNLTITQQCVFTPKTVGAYTDVTRYIRVRNPALDQIVIRDLVAAVATSIDAAAINGLGVGPIPLGILQNSLVPTVGMGLNGAAPNNRDLTRMKALVGNANAEIGRYGFLTTPDAEAKLRDTSRNAVGSLNIIDGDTFTLGCPWASTTLVPNNLNKGSGTNLSAAILGCWDTVVLGFWTNAYILVNPYLQSTTGMVRITVLTECDIQLRQPLAFAKIVDINTT